jgi:hypothetical protein
MEVPLPWERLLWSGRSWSAPLTRYVLTDFRLVAVARGAADEIALEDISEIRSQRSMGGRLLGASTLVVYRRNRRRPPFILRNIRHALSVGGVLQILASEHRPASTDSLRQMLAWEPRAFRRRVRRRLLAGAALTSAIFGVAIGVHGTPAQVDYPADDEVYPGGRKKEERAIAEFMETRVMPWARTALGPVVGGPDRVTCETCHGPHPQDRGWAMPAVAALPKPDVVDRGWERYNSNMDAQIRNAVYGYIAESDNQATAAYMREVVMPGIARLLHRPAYDFTRSYEYNRTHFAIGCYHCHRVK